MQNAAVLIGPIIIALVVGAVVVGLVLAAAVSALHALALHKEQSRSFIEQNRAARQLRQDQGAAIDAVIGELESRPATYETFPEDIKNALYAAHDKARQTERQLNR